MNKLSSLFLWVFIVCSFALPSSDSTIILSQNLNKPEINKSDSINTKENENNTIIGNDTISTTNQNNTNQIKSNNKTKKIMFIIGICCAVTGIIFTSFVSVYGLKSHY
jgi:hypothetical protein